MSFQLAVKHAVNMNDLVVTREDLTESDVSEKPHSSDYRLQHPGRVNTASCLVLVRMHADLRQDPHWQDHYLVCGGQ